MLQNVKEEERGTIVTNVNYKEKIALFTKVNHVNLHKIKTSIH